MIDLPSEFDNAWAAFQTRNSLRLIEETQESEWTRGRNEYLAFLIPIDDDDVSAQAAHAAERLSAIPGVEPYPDAYWHITVKGLGFQTEDGARSDEISPAGVQRIADAARMIFSDVPAFEARAGRINAFPEVVFLEVWDSLPVRDLNTRLLDDIPGLLRYPFDGPAFLPHISIARFTSSGGITQLKETIGSLRNEAPGTLFPIRHIDLIRAHLSASAPTFDLIERYRLS
jgi:2'-5' RNA ligase